jgi:hypothetical protein
MKKECKGRELEPVQPQESGINTSLGKYIEEGKRQMPLFKGEAYKATAFNLGHSESSKAE